jgi:cysteine desulfurase/selenocysteine lyase
VRTPVAGKKLKVGLDVKRVREDFPILRTTVRGKPLVYLDSTATSQKPKQVIEAIARYYREQNANVHRGAHYLGELATEAYEESRAKVGKFIKSSESQEIVFVRNTSEGMNLIAYSWGAKNVKAGDEVVVSRMEHHSNLVPWQMLCKRAGAKLRFIELNKDGTLDMESLQEIVTERTKIVSVTQMSNVLGTINDIKKISEVAHRVGAVCAVDGAQSVAHLPIDVRGLGCDFIAFSGHKMLGPMGIGALWGRIELLEKMEPFMGGGEMIKKVSWEEATWNDVPWKFEAGTPNVEGAVGLGAAVDYLSEIGMEAVREHEEEMTGYALRKLGEVEGIEIYGPGADKRGGVIAFNLRGIHPHDLATILDHEEGVAIRAGHHCAQPLMGWLETTATARASFYVYNLEEEVDALVRGLSRAREVME